MRRSGLPEDIANTAVYLASDLSSFVNGQRIAVDGGLTTGRLYRESMANAPASLALLKDAVSGA